LKDRGKIPAILNKKIMIFLFKIAGIFF